MHNNGVSHATAHDDYLGIKTMLQWLSYVPKHAGGPPALLPHLHDPIDREVTFVPPKGCYDPRWMLEGKDMGGDEWQTGFFDRNSFQEIMESWAQSVVCGRAR